MDVPEAAGLQYDRQLLLGGSKRDEVLSLAEVERYGLDSFGDRDYVSLYGLRPQEWYVQGIRILGRTAVECTRDRLADLIGRDVARVADRAPGRPRLVVDPFAGSANTLYWMHRHLRASRCVGFELDACVFEWTSRNLSLLGPDLDYRHADYRAALDRLVLGDEELLVAFVAPPWGTALGPNGLDLRNTAPPIAAIVDRLEARFRESPLLLGVQIHERVDPNSLAEITRRFAWSSTTTYGIDATGENNGLLLGTIRWKPVC